MAASPIATQVSKALDVHRNFTPTVTLNDVLFLNDLAKPVDIITIQIIAVHGIRKIHFVENLPGRGEPDPVYIGQCSI
jgi:hypothetical protein